MFLCVPVPSSNLYIQLNALQLSVDSLTMLWLSRLVMDISQSLEQCKQLYLLPDSQGYDEHLDIRVDVLMSKVRPDAALDSTNCVANGV